MSKNHDQSDLPASDDEDDDNTCKKKCLYEGDDMIVDISVSSDINKKLLKKKTWKCKTKKSKNASVQLGSAHVDIIDTLNMIDTYDRPASATAESKFKRSGTYKSAFEDKPGKRIPKIGAYAAAGVGRARAEVSVFEAEAKFLTASAEAEVSALGAGAMARAEFASASAKAGPVGVKVGLSLDTGASIGLGGVEAKILGIGFSIGPKTSISLFGSELSFSFL